MAVTIDLSSLVFTRPVYIDVIDKTTKLLKYRINEITDATLEVTADKNEIPGAGGRIIATVKRAKKASVKGTNAVISMGLMGDQSGSKLVKLTNEPFSYSQTVVVKGAKAKLSYKAVGDAGAEIGTVYINGDGTQKLTQGVTVAPTIFTYTAASGELTFDASIADGTSIYVKYKSTATNVLEIVNKANVFSTAVKLEMMTEAYDPCNANIIYYVIITFENAEPSDAFTLNFGDTGAVHDFDFSIMGSCGNDMLYTIRMAVAGDLTLNP